MRARAQYRLMRDFQDSAQIAALEESHRKFEIAIAEMRKRVLAARKIRRQREDPSEIVRMLRLVMSHGRITWGTEDFGRLHVTEFRRRLWLYLGRWRNARNRSRESFDINYARSALAFYQQNLERLKGTTQGVDAVTTWVWSSAPRRISYISLQRRLNNWRASRRRFVAYGYSIDLAMQEYWKYGCGCGNKVAALALP